MKKITFILLFITLKSIGQNILPNNIDLCEHGNWELVFEENFNGSTIDANKWLTFNSGYPIANSDIYHGSRIDLKTPYYIIKDQNVQLSNGICSLWLKSEPTTWYCQEHSQNHTKDYSAGMLETKNNYITFERGKIEAKIKMCGAPNSWNCFWLWSNDNSNEIDIAEFWGNDKTTVQSTLHRWINGNHYASANYFSGINYPGAPITTHFSSEWMIYTVEWDRNFITFHMDGIGGRRSYTEPRLNIHNPNATPYTSCTTTAGAYSTRPEFFMPNEDAKIKLTLGMEANNSSDLPAAMLVDYVRYYKRNECTDDIEIVDPDLFPFEKMNAKTLTMGSQNNSKKWNTIIPKWGYAKYEANAITMLPNFEVYPVIHDPTPNDGVADVYIPVFEFNAVECNENQMVENNRILDGENTNNYNLSETNTLRQNNTSNIEITKYAKQLTIHPNPTTGQLNITMPAPGDYDVKITNMLGVVVYQGKLKDEKQKQIQLESSLPSGNYTVQITGKEVNHIEKITLTR